MVRRILPNDQLAQYSAAPIHSHLSAANVEKSSSSVPEEAIGISLHSWDITTSHSNTIANEFEMDQLTTALQTAAMPSEKKLWPPEIVFFRSFLSLKFRKKNRFMEVRFDAASALLEWAAAHCGLIFDEEEGSNTDRKSCRGVSVLQTKDAKIWKEKRRAKMNLSSPTSDRKTSAFDPEIVIGTRNEFNFDWSYSTPFSGSIRTGIDASNEDEEGEEPSFETPLWKSRNSSGINIGMLTDTSQPILLFDHIILYEDDLHDNGEVQLSVKIRVMPNCFLVLQRLYLRVDFVLVRCRDTRIFHDFHSGEVMRDVTWREVEWARLSDVGLPSDVKSWAGSGVEDAKVQGFLNRLTEVDLPEDLPKHSFLEIDR